jgi:hypothetical protein
MNIVIFSKDRAMQLEALLRSYKEFCKDCYFNNITIIWKASTLDFLDGYMTLQENEAYTKDLGITWVIQTDFKKNVLESLKSSSEFSMFLVDDILFKEPFSSSDKQFITFRDSKEILCLSLRLWKGIDYCYPTNTTVTLPNDFDQFTGTWSWVGAEGDWGYPMSVDGHVFRTELISQIAAKLNYYNPNTFEGIMAAFSGMLKNYGKMICYPQGSKLLNLPINRVQNDVNNRFENSISAEEMNQRFLNGDRIDLKPFYFFPNHAPHVNAVVVFLKRI